MQPTAYDLALIGVGGIIVGALLGAWITFRFSLRLADITTGSDLRKLLISLYNIEKYECVRGLAARFWR